MFALLALLPTPFLYLPWRRANQRHPESKILLVLPALGALLWLVLCAALAGSNIKGASLANFVVELPVILLAASIVVLVRLQLFGHGSRFYALANALAIGAVAITVVLVRALVPELGE